MVRTDSMLMILTLASVTNTSPLGLSTTTNISHQAVGQSQKRWFGSPCAPLSYVTLVTKLNSIGGYNKRYVATTKEEAMRNFPTLLNTTAIAPNFTSNGTAGSATVAPVNVNATHTTPPASTAASVDPSHIAATPTLASRLLQPSPTPTPTAHAPKHINTQLVAMARRGTKDEYGFYRLCSEWTAITILSSDFFPRYLNEVICDSADFHCLSFGGLCVQKTFIVSVLRRSGRCTAQGLEEWLEYSQPIRSCCECKMFPGSAQMGLL